MYLKAIELENFKSFARKYRIELKPGFTAISGPNGSGKSNIGDAILFVLGPKSSKVIRANKLVDLIYDGGKTGKKADYCRVSLIFDNRDRVLPIDENEVKLTRYIKRANNDLGYNSYFYINDEPARLQDFESLLMHTKIDADGYNFVKQGDVTRIVEMTPVERRQILEEIAGISDFDREIEKAEMKKKDVEENMEKINVLLEEIENRLKVLEKDRETALKYRELEDRLMELRAKIAYSKMVNSRTMMNSYQRQIAKYEEKIAQLEREIEGRKEELDKIKMMKDEVDRRMNKESSGEVGDLKERIDELKIQAAKIRTHIERNQDVISENEEKVNSLKKEVKKEIENFRKSSRELQNLKISKEEKEKIYDEKRKKLEEMESRIKESNVRFREISEKIEKLGEEIEKRREIYNSKIVEENKIKERINSLLREIAKLEEEEKNTREGIRDAEWRISQYKNESKEKERKRKNLAEKYEKLKRRRVELQRRLEEKRKEITELRGKLESIRARMESRDPLSVATMAVLTARDKGVLDGIYGTVAELGSVDEKYKLAIEVAAGSRLMSIVCRDDESAAKAIEYLKKNHLGRAIFLPLNKMLAGRPRGRAILASRDTKSHGFAINLMKFDKKFEPAFWYVFGDTVVVEDLDTARKLMGGVRLVTLDGQLIEASGAMIGGSVERVKRISMGNVTEITEKLNQATEEERNTKAELESVEKEIENVLMEINSQQSMSTADMEIWKKERDRLDSKLAILLKDLREKKDEERHLENILGEIEKEVKVLGEEIQKIENERDRLRDEKDKLIPEKISKEVSELRGEVNSLRDEIEEISKRIIEKESEVKRLQEKREEKENEIEKLLQRNAELRKENEENAKKSEKISIERRKLEEVIRKEEEKIKDLIEKSNQYMEKINALERDIERMNGDVKLNSELKITLMGKMEEISRRYEDVRREYESYGIEINKVESISGLEKEMADVEAKIASLGPVNMKSIDEYDAETERYKRLKEDYSSLSKEKREMEKLVKEINEKKKYGLLKVYEAINKNFKEIYKEMSEGGEAQLLLDNPEDPFKGGLAIKVKPLGKGFKRLHALSGGEKSLAALAFIFAIQQYDPSPLYLLDEADMFLDGVNAEVLGKIIKRNSRSAQFIVISLRRATIKFADHIIGVTHRGDGISKIYMQEVPEVEENA